MAFSALYDLFSGFTAIKIVNIFAFTAVKLQLLWLQKSIISRKTQVTARYSPAPSRMMLKIGGQSFHS
jgi:hypothetical protein